MVESHTGESNLWSALIENFRSQCYTAVASLCILGGCLRMTLAAGTHLGPYEILSPLGAGGMGEVYLAEDTRLDRKVALKLLPAQFTKDEDRLRRFIREAKAA